MKLQAVSNRKLYSQIADQIRGQILSGTVARGAQLPSERDLAAALGVSRPTVREALIALEVAGLVEVRIGVGAFVSSGEKTAGVLPETGHSPLEIIAARRILEPEIAALASLNATDEHRARLGATLATMRTELTTSQWSAASDRDLHLTIADAAGNLVLRDILAGLWASRSEALDRRFHQHLAQIETVRLHILRDHEAIVATVSSGKADAARIAMADHLGFVERAMQDVWE